MNVQQNLQRIKQQIAAACEQSARRPEEVNIIAVTKYVGIDRMKEALVAGIEHLGENKAQDMITKYEAIGAGPTWHFIGHLQSNKVKDVIGRFDYIHSLDRPSLAKEIEKRAARQEQRVSCFVQVNVSGEDTKHGIAPEEAEDFIAFLSDLTHIRVVGLMTMAPFVDQPEETRSVFRALKELQLRLQKKAWSHASLRELSMGMSNDFPIAVEEGATFIRVGSALVGHDT
jgi:pyridoxal phosphate enzyme (YggS family)